MAFKEYGNYDAVGLAELVRNKHVSPTELLDEAIARTAKVDPKINAVVVKHYDYAQRQIARGLPDGPFTGVPFLLKDLDYLEGTRTTSGATILKDFVADHSGTLTQRFLDAGVAIFGKSSSPEFGLMPTTESRLFGPTRNPWNLDHSSGGSSGGAAAAVAARILPVAHASDGGGSIRIPASASGVFGLKPTRARNPVGPDRGEGWGGFSCRPRRQHQRARQRRDDGRHSRSRAVEPLYRAAAGTPLCARRSAATPADFVSLSPTSRPMATPSIHEIAGAVREIASLLAGLGHHVEERAPPLAADPAKVMATITGANTAVMVRQTEAQLGRQVTDQDFEVLTLATARNAAEGLRGRLRRGPTGCLPDFTRPRDVLRELRYLPLSDVVFAAAADRRAQLDVEGSVAYLADPAPLYAGDRDVQHVRPARDVGAARLEQGRIAARHDVFSRFGDEAPCSAWRASWNRSAPGSTCYRRFVPERTKLSLIRKRGKDTARQRQHRSADGARSGGQI